VGARFPVRFTGEAALVRTPTGSDGFQMTATVGRGIGGHGGLDGGDGALDCFLERRLGEAGGSASAGVLRPSTDAPILYTKERLVGVRKCADGN
jgi:hypothetical protein